MRLLVTQKDCGVLCFHAWRHCFELAARLVPEAAAVAQEAVALTCSPRSGIKPLNTAVLRILQRSLEQCGQGRLWNPIKDQLQRARLPLP
eukprot:s508_g9.t1